MNKQQIRNYIIGLSEFELLDFYNTIVCEYGSTDDMIHYNTSSFFKNEFINGEDAEQSKIKSKLTYNPKDKFIQMIEYMKLETSNELLNLINLNILTDLVYKNIDEVIQMGIIIFKLHQSNNFQFSNQNQQNISVNG